MIVVPTAQVGALDFNMQDHGIVLEVLLGGWLIQIPCPVEIFISEKYCYFRLKRRVIHCIHVKTHPPQMDQIPPCASNAPLQRPNFIFIVILQLIVGIMI